MCVIGKLVELLVGNYTGEIHFTEKEEKNFFFFPDELITFTPHTYPFEIIQDLLSQLNPMMIELV